MWLVLLLSVTVSGTELCQDCPILNVTGPKVFLTVSSLASVTPQGKISQRKLELNWWNDKVKVGDWVGLFAYNPLIKNTTSNYLAKTTVKDSPGYFTTNVELPILDLSEFSNSTKCLDFWIGYVRLDQVVAAECLKIRPQWMEELKDTLGRVKFKELMIPGTHNSGSWSAYKGQESENVFTKFFYCQEEDIWNQLVYGIRYFDIRVGYYPETEETFWINHNFAKLNPLKQEMRKLRNFLNKTKEIVILDFHRFPVGFNSKRAPHSELSQYLLSEFQGFIAPRTVGKQVKVRELWARNQTLIIAYADKRTTRNNRYFWKQIPQLWGNKQDINDLRDYLEMAVANWRSYRSLYALMTELTPTYFNMFLNPSIGLRTMADDVNRNLTAWFRDEWWNKCNIVATDYFLGNNIIDIAIDTNFKKQWCKRYCEKKRRKIPTTALPHTTTIPKQ